MKLHTHQGEAKAYKVAIMKVLRLQAFKLLCAFCNAQAVVVGGEEIHPRHHTGLYSLFKWLLIINLVDLDLHGVAEHPACPVVVVENVLLA